MGLVYVAVIKINREYHRELRVNLGVNSNRKMRCSSSFLAVSVYISTMQAIRKRIKNGPWIHLYISTFFAFSLYALIFRSILSRFSLET